MEISNNPQTEAYKSRTAQRELTLMSSTMSLVGYFMGLGDDQETAEAKVSGLSTEVAQFLYVYSLGNKTPLIDSINASQLVYMTAEAKAFLITALTV